ncbi:MAG TPA: response regulator [Chthoniobacteraceae bacterium]|nr:response regulator [Chthoniobacteraceae bacterium]
MSAKPENIFIVDDDRSVSTSLDRLLTANGFTTQTFSTAEALKNSGRLSLAACVILDINLPGISGLELARELRKGGGPRVGLVFITAYDQPQYRTEASALGALAYLPKPFTSEKLLTAVRAAMYATGTAIRERAS